MDPRHGIRPAAHPVRWRRVHLRRRAQKPHPVERPRPRRRRRRAGHPPVRRLRALGPDAHRAGGVQIHQREQVHGRGDQRHVLLLGGRLVRPHERQDGRRPRQDHRRGPVPHRGVEGRRHGPVARGVPLGVRRDHGPGARLLAARAGRGAAVQRHPDQEVLPDHGEARGQSDGGAGPVPADAVQRRLLLEGGRVSAGRGPAEGQHAGQGVLRRQQEKVQAGHSLAPHVVRAQEGAGEDVQERPRLGHFHGGHEGGRREEDLECLLSHQRGRREREVGTRKGKRKRKQKREREPHAATRQRT
mmetsp:Transcript_18147/g.37146  ORF Transcript_18147/g.37146 Transcript_18147/m.37146 type:complete len:301 (+) Transcript_18147:160-1062(+)